MVQNTSSTALRSSDPSTLTERKRLLKPYLPTSVSNPAAKPSRSRPKSARFQHKRRLRPALRNLLYSVIFTVIHLFFGVYIRLRQLYHGLFDRAMAVLYYHHRTPELIRRDVKRLKQVPQHLSVVLQLPDDGSDNDRLEALIHDACEVAAWSAGAGVPTLSIYEKSGALKSSLPHLHDRITSTLTAYYGATHPTKPTLSLRSPNQPTYSPPTTPTQTHPHLTILLIDRTDGRQTLVDLTKTLASMSQAQKLSPADITASLIDAEITESVMGEPDLLVLFGGEVMLEGYPPWQARLTEMFAVQDHGGGVEYHVFLRALYKYGKAEFRVGR